LKSRCTNAIMSSFDPGWVRQAGRGLFPRILKSSPRTNVLPSLICEPLGRLSTPARNAYHSRLLAVSMRVHKHDIVESLDDKPIRALAAPGSWCAPILASAGKSDELPSHQDRPRNADPSGRGTP
jgi:hypothetical protein